MAAEGAAAAREVSKEGCERSHQQQQQQGGPPSTQGRPAANLCRLRQGVSGDWCPALLASHSRLLVSHTVCISQQEREVLSVPVPATRLQFATRLCADQPLPWLLLLLLLAVTVSWRSARLESLAALCWTTQSNIPPRTTSASLVSSCVNSSIVAARIMLSWVEYMLAAGLRAKGGGELQTTSPSASLSHQSPHVF